MPEKSPDNYSLITYLWVLFLSVWGGIAYNIKKIKNGTIDRFSISELVGDIVISGFIGVMTFFMCEAAGFSQLVTAFLVGMSAHMGTRGLESLEKISMKILEGKK